MTTPDLRAALDLALGTLNEDDISYDHPIAVSGEPMDPVLFVNYERLRAALAEPSAPVEGLRAALVKECGFLPAHKHNPPSTTCVGCDLHLRIASLLDRFPPAEPGAGLDVALQALSAEDPDAMAFGDRTYAETLAIRLWHAADHDCTIDGAAIRKALAPSTPTPGGPPMTTPDLRAALAKAIDDAAPFVEFSPRRIADAVISVLYERRIITGGLLDPALASPVPDSEPSPRRTWTCTECGGPLVEEGINPSRAALASEEAGLDVRWDDIERFCPTCGGERWTVANDPDEREPYQVPCTNPLHLAIADERARLAAPSPSPEEPT